jgi:DNA-binding protein H-NS
MPVPNIKSLSVAELLALRDEIDSQLQAHRAELQAQLAQLGGVNSKTGRITGIKVPPKYRHPTTGETWSGRGGIAGWLTREIDAGHKLDDFLIDKPNGKGRRKSA